MTTGEPVFRRAGEPPAGQDPDLFDLAVVVPFRMQPGLSRMAAGVSFPTPARPLGDGRRAALWREKLEALRRHPRAALCGVDGFDPQPALQWLAAHASASHPGHWRSPEPARHEAPALGWALRRLRPEPLPGALPEVGAVLSALPAEWRLAALLLLAFEDDLAIVDGERATVPWLAVCLPSFWSPADKVGRGFADVHRPVAGGGRVRAAAAPLTRLVSGGEVWQRFSWSITAHPRHAADPARAAPVRWPDDVAGDILARRAWVRIEHQVFLPVPERCQSVFMIRLVLRPLAEVVDGAARARRLHDALASMDPPVLAYKGLAPARDRLLAWLADRAQGTVRHPRSG